jgi:class 3 adenylate cyclase
MCGKAVAGQILVTESTFNEVAAQFAMLPLPPVEVKGKSLPISVFTVHWKEAAAAV